MNEKKISFPEENITIRHSMFSSVPSLVRTADWDDLGWDETNAKHKFCGRELKIGREEEKLFKFCPRCKIKITK